MGGSLPRNHSRESSIPLDKHDSCLAKDLIERIVGAVISLRIGCRF